MNRDKLIEAMARAMYEADEGPWGDALMKEMRRYATAALSAIEAMAVVVPKYPTTDMQREGLNAHSDNPLYAVPSVYAAMLSASPYKKEASDGQ